jgi:Rab-GTPase-TBC domain
MSSLHSIFIRPAINPQKPTESHVPAAQLFHHGMSATLERFSARLHAQDAELAADLNEKGLETTFYAFRWFTCLAPGGLGLPDTIRLWDSLFADWCLEQETNPSEGDDGFRFLEDFGIAVLLYRLLGQKLTVDHIERRCWTEDSQRILHCYNDDRWMILQRHWRWHIHYEKNV